MVDKRRQISENGESKYLSTYCSRKFRILVYLYLHLAYNILLGQILIIFYRIWFKYIPVIKIWEKNNCQNEYEAAYFIDSDESMINNRKSWVYISDKSICLELITVLHSSVKQKYESNDKNVRCFGRNYVNNVSKPV